jgi:hypothetical protein
MSQQTDIEQLLAMHQQVIEAHFHKDVEGWLAMETADYVSANRGQISYPSKEERATGRAPYLQATEFSEYRDLVSPLVKVSDDGTLGWLICQVQASGVQTHPDGEEVSFTWVSAWIELYEKRDGHWLCSGNVSNFKPLS